MVQRGNGLIDRRAESAQGFVSCVVERHAVRNEIVDTLGEEGTQLFVGVGVDLCARAERYSQQTSHAGAEVAGSHRQLSSERAASTDVTASN